MNSPNPCSWCHVEAEANGHSLSRPISWGANCARHSDNIKAALTIFGASPASTKGTMQRIETTIDRHFGTFFMAVAVIVALACFIGCSRFPGLNDTQLKPAVVDADSGVTNEPAVMGKEINATTKALVRATGSTFGPVGEAIAECGLAVVALFMAGLNHRRLSKHLADSPGATTARVTRPRAPREVGAEA